MAFRYSSQGHEMYNSEVPGSVTWITPGLKMHSTIPLMSNYKSIWIYSWVNFYKHTAFGFNDSDISVSDPLFLYTPDYSSSFYTQTVSPDKGGMDFDQSEAGIAFLSDNFHISFGKFKTNLGPSMRSNLSISNNMPAFNQFFVKIFNEKIIFTSLFGELDSNIPLSIPSDSLYIDLWDDLWEYGHSYNNVKQNPEHSRFIAHHRLDFIIEKNIRLGIYEQVIFGGRNIPYIYFIPILPFWSSQHELGDLDNIMMGFDFEYIINNNRIYFALLMDEWAPYETFSSNNRNWFAAQFGYSRYLNIFGRDFLFKIEYADIDPRAYNHKYLINEPTHHGYNVGYWSGRSSSDFASSLSLLLNDLMIDFTYEYTKFFRESSIDDYLENLENQYIDEPILNLSSKNFRNKIGLSFTYKLPYFLYLDFDISRIKSNGLYNNDKFDDFKLNLRYNIKR